MVCDSGAGDDVEHLLVTWEFERDRWVMADKVSIIVKAEEWLKECGRVQHGEGGIGVGERQGGSKWH